MTADRLHCVVPFCRCTASPDRFEGSTEILCAKHWKHVGHWTKRRYAAARRILRRGHGDDRLYDVAARLWARAKRQAIEAAGGIA